MRLKIFLVQELANPMVCEFTTAYKLGDLHADYIWCHLILWQEWDSQHLFQLPEESVLELCCRARSPGVTQCCLNPSPIF